MKQLKQMTISTVLLAILMIVVGILFLVSPIQSSIATVRCIASLLIAIGIINIYSHFKYKQLEIVFNRNGFLIGIFEIILGIFMFRQEGFSIFVFSVMFSALLFFYAIEIFEYSITMKKMNVDGWLLTMILAIILIIDSIILMCMPPLAFETLTLWIAYSLIFVGISTLIGIYRINKTVNNYKTSVENYINEVKKSFGAV